MLNAILLGTLAATAAAAQDEDDKYWLEIDIDIPAIEIQIPKFHYEFDYSFHYHYPDIEIEIAESVSEYLEYWSEYWEHWSDNWVDWSDQRDYWSDHWRSDDWKSDHLDVDTDTVIEVNPNARLEVRNHAGEIVIRTWNRNQVRVEASHSSRDRVKVLASESSVTIRSESRHGPPDVVDYEFTVPSGMALDLWGVYTDVSVTGSMNGVRVETLQGDIELRNVEGDIRLSSVEGEIVIQRAIGRIEVNTVEDDITLVDVEGDIYAESIDGEIRLDGIRSHAVEAKTVDGDVSYSGMIMDGGRYRLTTHDGDVVVTVPGDVNVTVSVATFDGEFEATFPVELSRAEASRRFTFQLGDGSAKLELHSFDGDIQLVRQ